jgi:aryl-alcohol dehydrogenase-like predicted oxidoreductase
VEYATLGKSGLEVSRICFGTWQFGGAWGAVDQDAATEAVRRALEMGVTFFDTAQAYGWGSSESLLARALGADIRREEVVVATKCGVRLEDGREVPDSSRAWIRSSVELSLHHLGVEAIDLLQVHRPDPGTPIEETAAALEELTREGKVRHVGLSNFSAGQMEEFERTRPVETLQPPFSLLERDAEATVLPWCEAHDTGVLAYGPLAHGLLSGRFSRDTRLPSGDWRRESELFRGARFERTLEAVERLRELAEERGVRVAQLAVAWVLAHTAVHVAIVGGRRAQQVEEIAAAADIVLAGDELAEIERIAGV